MTSETQELMAFAEKRKLNLDIVYANPPNTPRGTPPRFYLVAEDGVLLYQPADLGGTIEAARSSIYQKAVQNDALEREANRPYYGG